MNKWARRFYEFGRFRMDLQERLLFQEGERQKLTYKAFDVLAALVENEGHLLTKEDLMSHVWPDSFVEENNLAQCISQLRRVLGEQSSGNKYIETVPRRGYRFTAEVRAVTEEADAADESTRAEDAVDEGSAESVEAYQSDATLSLTLL
ncbi:MAG: transcriptional regulator [Acidobacteria bacterium]|nr:transcriptional regulator [Acidobacteriota bacterium]